MKNWKIVTGVVVGLTVVAGLVLLLAAGQEERPFKQVELTANNSVLNGTDLPYYDTIMSVGLDQAGLSNILITIEPLSDRARSQFDGSLKAHIRYWDGQYYLFIGDFGRTEAIEVISHEIVHIQQYESQDLTYDNTTGDIIWKDRLYTLETNYEDRPWETDAFSKQSSISDRITSILY